MQVHALNHDPAVLDLVVHFLGIALHHNINAAPSEMPPHGKVITVTFGDRRPRSHGTGCFELVQ
jgi:hypothetical protein